MRISRKFVVPAGVAVMLSACGGSPADGGSAATASPAALPSGTEAVHLDPHDFTTAITNPWWPMAVGDRWSYTETDADGAEQRVEVTVLDETQKVAMGIEARVVHDQVTDHGAVVEDTRDWYAQDADGNIWYLGERTAEYENGQLTSTEGSWEAGVDGAQPGIAIPAEPRPGLAYRQEYLKGQAEDAARVLSTDEQVEVPTGHYRGVLMTRETTPLEPDTTEYKFYARGIGEVMAVQTSGGTSTERLVRTTRSG
jgi:hypothetical protein